MAKDVPRQLVAKLQKALEIADGNALLRTAIPRVVRNTEQSAKQEWIEKLFGELAVAD